MVANVTPKKRKNMEDALDIQLSATKKCGWKAALGPVKALNKNMKMTGINHTTIRSGMVDFGALHVGPRKAPIVRKWKI